ncbi:MAG TPA: flagellar biosynthetic protein FliO [Bryobacteraceae bacterium]|jgi:flagellar biogenesis protein FliO|nr:flagellar biosynthetic protein FliO [Bryobacteraceae bacterium]
MEIISQFGMIGLTLALLAVTLWLLRRKGLAQFNRGRSQRLLEVVESRPLAPGHTLLLVRVADRAMALATHGGGCTLLETRPWREIRPETEVRS